MTALNDTFNIPGRFLVCRVDGKTRIHGSVSHIYSQTPVICKSIMTHTSCHSNGMVEILVNQIHDPIHGNMSLASIYMSPCIPLHDFV